MSNDIITWTVVCGPTTLTLGKPVGQQLSGASTPDALRWKGGQWVGQSSIPQLLPKFWRPALPSTIRLATSTRPSRRLGARAALGVAAVMLLAVGAGAGLMVRQHAQPEAALPIARASETAAVQVVTAAYEPSGGTQGAGGPGLPAQEIPAAVPADRVPAAAPLAPPTPPTAAAPPAPLAPLPVSLPAVPSRPAAQTPGTPSIPALKQAPAAAAATASEPPVKVPAVVLDEVAASAQKAAQQPSPAQKPPAPPVKAETVAKTPLAAGPVAASAPPTAPRGTGLVAITPDGKLALFTNPKTRLPEQFKVGDQLPGGETVRTIDPKEGRVLTSSKEYHLD